MMEEEEEQRLKAKEEGHEDKTGDHVQVEKNQNRREEEEAEKQPPTEFNLDEVIVPPPVLNLKERSVAKTEAATANLNRSNSMTEVALEDAASIEVDLMQEISNFMDGEEEEPREVLADRVKELERDRGQLAKEAMEKDEIIGRMEREVDSMKAEVTAAEEEQRQSREEAENRMRRSKEETDTKIEEVSTKRT
jgi:hypothetical protein